MPTLTVLMAPPGAGKTTWIAANRSPGQVICSTERIRTDRALRPAAIVAYLSALQAKARRELAAGRDVLVDGCNTKRRDRSRWLGIARELGASTHLVVLDTPLATALAVQRDRAHPVPEMKVAQYHREFTQALAVIHGEGWGRITHVSRDGHRSRATAAPQRVRASTSARGYDAKHRRLREQWRPRVEAGLVDCWRCGERIQPYSHWDLGHDDYDRSKYKGPEHRECNRATKGMDRVNPQHCARGW